MASLTYLIYQENRRDKDGPNPCDERYRAVFSSFRKKSIVLESGKPERREPSVRSISSDPPKIRELIEESGILEVLELGQEIDATIHADDERNLARNHLVRRPSSIRVDDKLRKVVDEVLKWDDNDSVPSMHGSSLGVHSKSVMSDHDSVMDQSQSTTPTRSNASSYKEIPYDCTPQFNPEISTGSELEMNLRKSSPPRLESGQPPRPSLTLRLPSHVDASRLKPGEKYKANVVNGYIANRHDSISNQSCQTGVSEVTWQCEPNSPVRKFTLNPRAQQYQIAKEQEKEEKTKRTNNHSAMRRKTVKPPVRRPSPEADSPDPPVRKQSSPTHPRPVAVVTPESEEKAPLYDDIGRKGTIGGSVAAQPLPRKPQDSDPIEASNGRVSPRVDRVNERVAARQAAVAILIKPSAAKRRARAKPITPDHDQSARLFPHGIGYYGRKPLVIPSPPTRIPSPLAHPPRISLRHQLRPLLEPLGNDSSEDLSKLGSQSSRISLSELTSDDEAHPRTVASDVTSETSIRVQLVPREITFYFEGKNRVHTGLYTGPINRYNRMHGNGVFWFNTGDVYLGQFSEGSLHGVGCMTIHMDDGSKQVLRGFFRKNEYIGTEIIPDDLEDAMLD